jgi:hypothetical protein
MKPVSKSADTLLAIIRGEMPLSVLPELGIEVARPGGRFELKSSLSEAVVKPSVSDIARGLLMHRLNRDDLMTWAFFVLGAAEINFREVESHPQGEDLIEALWDASFEGKLSSEALRIADSLT